MGQGPWLQYTMSKTRHWATLAAVWSRRKNSCGRGRGTKGPSGSLGAGKIWQVAKPAAAGDPNKTNCVVCTSVCHGCAAPHRHGHQVVLVAAVGAKGVEPPLDVGDAAYTQDGGAAQQPVRLMLLHQPAASKGWRLECVKYTMLYQPGEPHSAITNPLVLPPSAPVLAVLQAVGRGVPPPAL